MEDTTLTAADPSAPTPALASAASTPRRARIGPFVWWLGLCGTVLVLVVGSALAYSSGLPATIQRVAGSDKLCHLGMFGALAFFLDGALRRKAIELRRVPVPLATILILVPAAIEEYLQRYSPNRSSSIWDFAADVAGVAAGLWFSRRIDR